MDKRNEVSEIVFLSKYAQTKSDGTKETPSESISRAMNMHYSKLIDRVSKEDVPRFNELFTKIWDAYDKFEILGAQRALQFGGDHILKHNAKIYNCSFSYADRPDFFKDLAYLLLCGCGVGFSVQKRHISNLPLLKGCSTKSKKTFIIPDSIEGWAMAINELIESYFNGTDKVEFDYSQIRPEGSLIAGTFKAPGYKPLQTALESIENLVLKPASKRTLKSIEVYRICCFIARAVVSGGVRRSALLCLFDAFDEDMMKAKTPGWFERNPEFAMSNNSAVILPTTKKEIYEECFESCKKFGEPGFAFLKNPDYGFNPCFEIGIFPKTFDGRTGFGFCNLTNANASKCKTKEDLFEVVKMAAYLGTIQASYTDFGFLSEATKEIVERDSLIGVGLTGMCDNPKLIFNEEIQREAAKIVVEANKEMARIIKINPAARTTCVKP